MQNNFKVRILKQPSQTASYVNTIQAFADSNKKAFGFLPKSAFFEQASNSRLWVAINPEKEQCMGYLMFGGRFPTFKIFQIFVSKHYRNKGIGTLLLKKFEDHAEKNNYLSINVRVAADLYSNKFWEKSGYEIVKQEKGGKTTKRNINIRIKELKTQSLINLMSFHYCVDKGGLQTLKRTQRPIFRSPTYVIDLNVFFDVVKKRIDYENAARLLSSGLNNEIKIYVTPEFCSELKRNKRENEHDPIYEFSLQLPTLPEIEEKDKKGLIEELKAIVFPERTDEHKQYIHHISDLLHLAYCVHHGATGFITREKAILAAADQLKDSYFIEVLSASDLSQPKMETISFNIPLSVYRDEEKISICTFEEKQRESVEKFLISMQVKKQDVVEILHPGTNSSPRIRLYAKTGDRIIGVASWDSYTALVREKILYLYVDEDSSKADMVIDHVLEASLRGIESFCPFIMVLNTGIEQPKTISTALNRGFLSSTVDNDRSHRRELSKFVFNGMLTNDIWYNFKLKFEELTEFKLPERMPTEDEFNNTGIIIKNHKGKPICLTLFDFETLVSPGIVLCPGRGAVIVPIRKKYAQNLFAIPHTQLDLFYSPEALLHIEKAYFRSYRNAAIFKQGNLILFYISGSDGGAKEILGCGRITYSENISVNKAELLLERQGALTKSELKNIANRDNIVHAITFDNYYEFNNKISFSQLKSNKLISGANLVTAELILHQELKKICEIGFNNDKKIYD
jgi:GNAT superfamily N-acetyltransferase/predicted nucleic acid-binding protein